MSDDGIITADGTVRFERLLPGPIERVWAYLTEPDKRGTWLAGGPMELRPGGKVELYFRPAMLTSIAETVPDQYSQYKNGKDYSLKITRCAPPFLLSHTWPDDCNGIGGSEVTYELTPKGDKVQLVLTHRRLTRQGMGNVGGGWHTHLGILADRLNDRAPPSFWQTLAHQQQRYEARLAALPQ